MCIKSYFIILQIYGWKPVFYNDTKNLPEKMSEELKKYINEAKNDNPNSVSV